MQAEQKNHASQIQKLIRLQKIIKKKYTVDPFTLSFVKKPYFCYIDNNSFEHTLSIHTFTKYVVHTPYAPVNPSTNIRLSFPDILYLARSYAKLNKIKWCEYTWIQQGAKLCLNLIDMIIPELRFFFIMNWLKFYKKGSSCHTVKMLFEIFLQAYCVKYNKYLCPEDKNLLKYSKKIILTIVEVLVR